MHLLKRSKLPNCLLKQIHHKSFSMKNSGSHVDWMGNRAIIKTEFIERNDRLFKVYWPTTIVYKFFFLKLTRTEQNSGDKTYSM